MFKVCGLSLLGLLMPSIVAEESKPLFPTTNAESAFVVEEGVASGVTSGWYTCVILVILTLCTGFLGFGMVQAKANAGDKTGAKKLARIFSGLLCVMFLGCAATHLGYIFCNDKCTIGWIWLLACIPLGICCPLFICSVMHGNADKAKALEGGSAKVQPVDTKASAPAPVEVVVSPSAPAPMAPAAPVATPVPFAAPVPAKPPPTAAPAAPAADPPAAVAPTPNPNNAAAPPPPLPPAKQAQYSEGEIALHTWFRELGVDGKALEKARATCAEEDIGSLEDLVQVWRSTDLSKVFSSGTSAKVTSALSAQGYGGGYGSSQPSGGYGGAYVESEIAADSVTASNKVGKYTLIEQLGHGAFGEAHLAEAPNGDRVVVKLIQALGMDAQNRALKEATALAKIPKHPHMLDFIDQMVIPDRIAIVTQYCAGGNVDDIINKAPMGVTLVAMVIRQTAEGLAVLHAHDFAHRDIKPDNLLLKEAPGPDSCHVVIGDFGLTREVETDDGYYQSGMGHRLYKAPEAGLDNHTGPKTDMWALGCVALSCLTGITMEKRHEKDRLVLGALPQEKIEVFLDPLLDVAEDRGHRKASQAARRLLRTNSARRPTAEEIVQMLQ